MADGNFASKVSADRQDNAVTNPIFVRLTDGTTAIGVTSNALDVNIASGSLTINSEYAEDSVHGSGDIGSFSLAVRNDTLASLVDTDGDYAPFQVNALGALYVAVDGSVTVTATQLDVDDLNLTDDAVRVSGNSSANTETNPIFVKTVDTVVSGEEIHDYDTVAAVAGDATSNHDYTVAGTNFFLKSVIVAASGDFKFEIQTGPVASLATVAVGFASGKEGDTKQVRFDPAIEVPVTSTGTVRVIRTNREGSAQDVYSTIIGNDV
jgi:hypothetical protein